jgi:hypothetical protein
MNSLEEIFRRFRGGQQKQPRSEHEEAQFQEDPTKNLENFLERNQRAIRWLSNFLEYGQENFRRGGLLSFFKMDEKYQIIGITEDFRNFLLFLEELLKMSYLEIDYQLIL